MCCVLLIPRRPVSSTPLLSPRPPTTYIYTLSLHDALPIFQLSDDAPLITRYVKIENNVPTTSADKLAAITVAASLSALVVGTLLDRKSTRLNSSHRTISYAVFCLKKKKKNKHC